MSPIYLALRILRRWTPVFAARGMLDIGLILQPGPETHSPKEAVQRYRTELDHRSFSLSGKSVLVFGYGGNYGVGIGFLQAGAAVVTLCDPFARPSKRRNGIWADRFPQYFDPYDGLPRQDLLRLLHADVRRYALGRPPEFDLIVSSSVFEHVDDCQGVTSSLAALTRPDGAHLHFIDLRDHFFRYPFEMLMVPESLWRRFLNPPSNLNRLRAWEFESCFARRFEHVDTQVVEALPEAFARARRRIRPEFLSGDPTLDAAGIISIWATGPSAGQASPPARRP